VALAVVLLTGSGLLIRSFMKLQGVDKGFAPQSTVTMNIQLARDTVGQNVRPRSSAP
jgi:hypothetical protein